MAITVLYDLLKADINEKTKCDLIREFDQVLSLDLMEAAQRQKEAANYTDAELEAYILERIQARTEAKKAKDFATADAIREELLAKGVAIKDTREGTKWELV